MTPVKKARMTHTATDENWSGQYELMFILIEMWVIMHRNTYRAALCASDAMGYHADMAKSENHTLYNQS